MKINLSLVIITLNEESNLERCIRSVPFASDIVVVDGQSSDRTREIAQKLGARVIVKEWMGFGPQKRFAVEQAQFDWVLCLDADEVLSSDLQQDILSRFPNLDAETAYEFPRKSYHLGRWIMHGGWYPDYQRRLFHRRHCQWNDARIHEKVTARKSARFQTPIEHFVFRDLGHQVTTNDRYSGLLAKSQFAEGKRFSFSRLLFKPPTKFLECYVLKAGFRDGLPGFIIAVSAAYSIFLRWAKLWEMDMQQKAKLNEPK